MKRITSILIACLAFTLLTAGCAAAATIEVRADQWPPYNDEPGSAQPGYVVELLEAIFAPQGHEINYQLLPWARTLADVRKGSVDAAIGTDRDESADFVFPAEPCGINQNGFFVKAGNAWKFDGAESLKSVRLGVIQGYGYYSELDDYLAAPTSKGKFYEATGDDALPKLIKMLQAGRIDVLIENVNVMNSTLQGLNLGKAVTTAGLYAESPSIYVAFSPAKDSSQEYSKIYDAGIVALRKSGQLEKIMSSYGLKDWK